MPLRACSAPPVRGACASGVPSGHRSLRWVVRVLTVTLMLAGVYCARSMRPIGGQTPLVRKIYTLGRFTKMVKLTPCYGAHSLTHVYS